MTFDQSWLSDLMEIQKKVDEIVKNKNSSNEIQSLVRTVLGQWGIPDFPWEGNSQFTGGFQKNEPYEAQNDPHFNIDISEKKQSIEIKIKLPGIEDSNGIQIKLSGNTLNINATMNRIDENESSFTRKIRLPSEVTPTGASAVYKNNYLSITLAKIPPEGESIPLDFYPPL